jgi:hypothetical protein
MFRRFADKSWNPKKTLAATGEAVKITAEQDDDSGYPA